MNTARCQACNTVVRLPHARSRASHARCEECHRRAAGAYPSPGRYLAIASGGAQPTKKLRERITPPAKPLRSEQLLDQAREAERVADHGKAKALRAAWRERMAQERQAQAARNVHRGENMYEMGPGPTPAVDEKLRGRVTMIGTPPASSRWDEVSREWMGPSGWARRGLL